MNLEAMTHRPDPICPLCGEPVPYPLPEGATIWHAPIPRSEGQWYASIEGVGVMRMERCTPLPSKALEGLT